MELNDLDRKIMDTIPKIRAQHNACTWGEVARVLGMGKPYVCERGVKLVAAGYVQGGGKNDIPGSVIVVKRPGDPLPPPTPAGLMPPPPPPAPTGLIAVLSTGQLVPATPPPPPPPAPTDDDALAAQVAAAAARMNVPTDLIEKAKMQASAIALTPAERTKETRNAKDRAKRAAAGKKTVGPRANASPRARKVAETTGRGKIDGRVAQHRRPVKQTEA